YGTLLVNFGKSYFSESFPQVWLFLMGALFIGVVMFFPNGLAGLYESHGKKLLARLPVAGFLRRRALGATSASAPKARRSSTGKYREHHGSKRFRFIGRGSDGFI